MAHFPSLTVYDKLISGHSLMTLGNLRLSQISQPLLCPCFFFSMRNEKGTGKFAGHAGRHYRIIGPGSSI